MIATLLALSACERAPTAPIGAERPTWREATNDELTPAQQAARDAALAAVSDLQRTLLAEVAKNLEARGPAATITVCKDLAPQLAEQVGNEHGLRIGRTSHRLRNPGNAGPAWMDPVIGARRDELVTMIGPGDAVRVAIPIHVAAPCLACHGQNGMLAPGVVSALDEQYPQDAATGFAEGELRGWFWAETAE